MAIKQSAKKDIRSSAKKHAFNLRRKRKVQGVLKDIEKLLADNKVEEAEKKLSEAYKAIDKATKMNTMKKNTASRKKSRLSAQIKKAKSGK